MMNNLKEIVLSILFVNGEGIEVDDITEKLGITKKEMEKVIKELSEIYNGDCGIRLISYKNKIQLCSNPNYADQISDVLNPIREKALTKAAMQTLAIVAYKQPITKLEIEEIRQTGCDYAVQLLMDHKMIEVVGRKDAVGKPLLLGTTEEFLKRFNLKDINELPDFETLLERIKIINEPQSTSLYHDFQLPDEEPIPDFLADENIEKISESTQNKAV